MLRDVKNFIKSRTDLADDAVLREINFAWKELWASDDLPNSLFELTVVPGANEQRISLPYYVGVLRGVKRNCNRERVVLNTPRPYYQDISYEQSPYTWRILGTSSLKKTISNATTLDISIPEAETARFVVTVEGPTDNAQKTREQVIFNIGDTAHETTNRFTDAFISKDLVTAANVTIAAADGTELALIYNDAFEALNTIVQIVDKCNTNCCAATSSCDCFDILYKARCPYLYYDETYVPFEEVLMQKTMEWIMMPKEGQEQKTLLYSEKSRQLATAFNSENMSIEKRLDLGRNPFTSTYSGLI